jgi:hypothetical protein
MHQTLKNGKNFGTKKYFNMKTFATLLAYVSLIMYRVFTANFILIMVEYITQKEVPLWIWILFVFSASLSAMHSPKKMEELNEE